MLLYVAYIVYIFIQKQQTTIEIHEHKITSCCHLNIISFNKKTWISFIFSYGT